MPTITLTITLTVPEGTTVNIDTGTELQEPTVDITQVEVPAITAPEPAPIFHGEHGEAPSTERTWIGWWSEAEDDLAQDMTISDEDLAACIDRTVAAVHSYRLKAGYYEPIYHRTIFPARRAMARWTDVEVVELLQLVGIHGESWDYIGRRLGRSSQSVKRQYSRTLVKEEA